MSTRIAIALAAIAGCLLVGPSATAEAPTAPVRAAAAAPGAPNIFFYNLDDLRDAFPGSVDPLLYMPKVRQWMAAGTRYTQHFVAEPSCCPSRSSLMTGRYPHNNGVRLQSQGPSFDQSHSLACYLQDAGYSTYVDGKFLTTWPKTQRPPCFDHSTVMWGGYTNVATKVDGVSKKSSGYSTTVLGTRGREYVTQGLASGKPFFLYETPQAPHWIEVTETDGTVVRRALPAAGYANADRRQLRRSPGAGPVRQAGLRAQPELHHRPGEGHVREPAASDHERRRRVRRDDAAFVRPGVLANTLVVFSSDNGYMWGEHGRTEKFVPYEPSMRTPLWIRWPGTVPAGTNTTRLVSYIDLMPTMLEAAGAVLPAGAPLSTVSPSSGRRRGPRSTGSTGRTPRTARPAPGRWCGPPPPSTSRPTTRPARR